MIIRTYCCDRREKKSLVGKRNETRFKSFNKERIVELSLPRIRHMYKQFLRRISRSSRCCVIFLSRDTQVCFSSSSIPRSTAIANSNPMMIFRRQRIGKIIGKKMMPAIFSLKKKNREYFSERESDFVRIEINIYSSNEYIRKFHRLGIKMLYTLNKFILLLACFNIQNIISNKVIQYISVYILS